MITRESMRDLALSVLPHSKRQATNLRALLIALADMLWEELGEPVAEYEHWPNPNKMTGRRLDDLGACMGLRRPQISLSDDDFFAFHGQTGETFSQAPFWSVESSVQNRRPMSDENYRPFLLWRLGTLGGAPTHGELRRGPFNVADGYYGFDGGGISASGNTITVTSGTVEGTTETLWNFLRSSQESLSRAMLPRVAGKTYSFTT